MTTTTQQTWADQVDSYLEGIEAVSAGPCPGCADCGLEDIDCADEIPEGSYDSDFSWSSCESCGSHLGGDRHPAHGLLDGRIVHLDVCIDCLLYLANGDLPESPGV